MNEYTTHVWIDLESGTFGLASGNIVVLPLPDSFVETFENESDSYRIAYALEAVQDEGNPDAKYVC